MIPSFSDQAACAKGLSPEIAITSAFRSWYLFIDSVIWQSSSVQTPVNAMGTKRSRMFFVPIFSESFQIAGPSAVSVVSSIAGALSPICNAIVVVIKLRRNVGRYGLLATESSLSLNSLGISLALICPVVSLMVVHMTVIVPSAHVVSDRSILNW